MLVGGAFPSPSVHEFYDRYIPSYIIQVMVCKTFHKRFKYRLNSQLNRESVLVLVSGCKKNCQAMGAVALLPSVLIFVALLNQPAHSFWKMSKYLCLSKAWLYIVHYALQFYLASKLIN